MSFFAIGIAEEPPSWLARSLPYPPGASSTRWGGMGDGKEKGGLRVGGPI